MNKKRLVPIVAAAVFALIMLCYLPLYAHQVALKNGFVIHFQKYRVADNNLYYLGDDRKEVSVPLNTINMELTQQLNTAEKTPLKLPTEATTKAVSDGSQPASLGVLAQRIADVARKNQTKDAHITAKRVWTSDDFSSTGEEESTVPLTQTPESVSETLREFRALDKEKLGAAVLKMANAPDVNFPDRRNWEQELFEAKQAWMDQLDRMVGHKDSSKDSQNTEIQLAQGAKSNFERISEQGIQQARAVNDPSLKAHLEYQRRLDFCRQTSGDLLGTCLAGLDQFKRKMQREGIW